jgi:formate dehydrogenase subunit gamma
MNIKTSLRYLAVGALLLASPVAAQQPTSVNPTASSVKEKQLLEALKPGSGDILSGRVSIPDAGGRNLIQPGGQEFRSFRDGTLSTVGKVGILGTLALLAVFFLIRGRIRIAGGPSGQTIERFGSASRFAHWLSATSFMLLGLTGLNIAFGKSVLLPVIGADAFTTVTQAGKFVHNYVSFAFAIGIALMFVMWVKDNLPSGRDITWFAQGGGLVGSKHPPADRFNGGQKLIFWTTVLGGIALSVSGYIMMFRRARACRPDHDRDHLCPRLYRLDRDGRRVRCDGQRQGRFELGKRTSQRLGRQSRKEQPRSDLGRPTP